MSQAEAIRPSAQLGIPLDQLDSFGATKIIKSATFLSLPQIASVQDRGIFVPVSFREEGLCCLLHRIMLDTHRKSRGPVTEQ